MARKSPWQQFGDNFESTYGAFNKMFQGMETAGIMREKPEEEIIQEGPRNSYDRATGKWTYGGQTYDAPISDEKLTGLRNTRLTNVMTKYGDIKGGMDLQLRQKELEQKTIANEIARATAPDVIEQAGQATQLNEQGLAINKVRLDQAHAEHQQYLNTMDANERLAYAKALGAELDTDGQIIAIDIARATKDDVIKGVKLGVRAQEIANINAELAGDNLKIDIDGNLIALDVAKATKDLKIQNAALENARKILENKGLYLTTEGQVLDLERSKAIHQKQMINDALALDVQKQELESKQRYNTAYSEFARRSQLEPGTEGAFATQKEANDFLLQSLNDIDPELAMELSRKYETNEIAGITHQGVLLRAKANAALESGGIDAMATAIDEMNGVDKMVKVTREGDIVTLNEIDADGHVLRTIATGNEKNGEFFKNLDMALDPANMMDTAKDYYDSLAKQSEIAYNKALEEYKKTQTEGLKNAKAEFKKDDFFIRLLMDNPEDTMAWAGLVGMDMSMDEIDAEIISRRSTEAMDNVTANGGTIDKTKGLADNVNVAGTMKVDGITQIDTSGTQNEQAKQKATAKREVTTRVSKVFDIIKKDIKPWTFDRNLKAEDKAAQVLRDTALDWLKDNRSYFLYHPDQLAAFEANPEQWVDKNITNKDTFSEDTAAEIKEE